MTTARKLVPSDPYALVEAVATVLPEGYTVECIAGQIVALPRPKPPHTRAASRLGRLLGPFDDDPGEPGGWILEDEPELHLGSAHEVAVPDLAGWRREHLTDGVISVCEAHGYYNLAPEWICEVLSPSTEVHDRGHKVPLYARVGVTHLWLLDPVERLLEVYRLEQGRYDRRALYRGNEPVRAEPFDALPLRLAALWSD